MSQSIALVALVVEDYDSAIDFYSKKMGFELLKDIPQGGKRWVVMAPPGGIGCSLLLAQASSPEQVERLGNQTGGRVFLFLHSDDFWRDYERMRAAGVIFTELPRQEPYGTVAVFEDLYGNRWDLLEPKSENQPFG